MNTRAFITLPFLLATLFHTQPTHAQQMTTGTLEQRIARIEDRQAIKNVVDVFSNLADVKQIDKQVLLFTNDAVVTSYAAGALVSELKGRAQLLATFSGFLAGFDVVYHQNGQQTIDELTDSTAKATSYCHVILVGMQDGKRMKTTMHTIYSDEFVKRDGVWLIAQRRSDFVWREVEEVGE